MSRPISAGHRVHGPARGLNENRVLPAGRLAEGSSPPPALAPAALTRTLGLRAMQTGGRGAARASRRPPRVRN